MASGEAPGPALGRAELASPLDVRSWVDGATCSAPIFSFAKWSCDGLSWCGGEDHMQRAIEEQASRVP